MCNVRLTCQRCGGAFATEDKRRRYCGRECYRQQQCETPNSGTFSRGLIPWNRDLKGIHLSPASEFKPGMESTNRLPVGSIRIRHRERGDERRAWVKVAEPNVWRMRAVVEWEKVNGPLPDGMVVHHRDRNSLNDAPSNLQALTRAQHIAEHRGEFTRAA